jgi:hypothetical protein
MRNHLWKILRRSHSYPLHGQSRTTEKTKLTPQTIGHAGRFCPSHLPGDVNSKFAPPVDLERECAPILQRNFVKFAAVNVASFPEFEHYQTPKGTTFRRLFTERAD